jgi:hypothetical protein
VFSNEESKNNYIPIFMAVAHEILTGWRINSMEIHEVKQQQRCQSEYSVVPGAFR